MDGRDREARRITPDELAAQTAGLALELDAAFELGRQLPDWLVGRPMRTLEEIEVQRARCERVAAYAAFRATAEKRAQGLSGSR